jgi:uncharacterized membrane protein
MDLGRHHPAHNLNQAERVGSVLAGIALGGFGLREALKRHSVRSVGLVLGGAALVKRGITGYCDVYRSLGINTAAQHPGRNATIPYQQGVRVDRSITIQASREQVYAFWRNLENLPRFMKHVKSVKQMDDLHSHWVVDAPSGTKVEWDAEIINEIPGELIGWRSLPGASVSNAGSVRFEHSTGGRGTKVSVSLQYDAPAGQVGAAIARLLGKDPAEEVDVELHRLKNILEAGEIPTSAGQPTGRGEPVRQSVKQQTAKVQDASEASFPASDAPAYSHVGE